MKKNILLLLLVLSQVLDIQAVDKHWALYDVPAYEEFHDGMAIFRKDNKYGAINANGEIALSNIYLRLEHFNYGVAYAKTEKGDAIINTKGQFIIAPQKNIVIQSSFGVPGFYYLKDTVNKKIGAFYINKQILPIEYSFVYISDDNFPFVQYNDSVKNYLNIVTNEIFVNAYVSKEPTTGKIKVEDKNNNINLYYDSNTGCVVPIDTVSPNGIIIKKGNYGYYLANMADSVLSETMYSPCPMWINGMIAFLKSSFRDKTKSIYISLVYNSKGEKIFEKESPSNIVYINGKYIKYQNSYINGDDMVLIDSIYDMSGNFKYGGSFLQYIAGDYFFSYAQHELVNVLSGKVYNVKFEPDLSEDMISFVDKNNRAYIIDVVNNKSILLPLNDVYRIVPFHEELAVVELNKSKGKFVVNKKGNIVMQNCSDYEIFGNQFSEGVISVYDNKSYKYGYYYNPIKCTYAYNNEKVIQKLNENLMIKGDSLALRGLYGRAKDSYYAIMINDPVNIEAINKYSVCLNNIGDYDGASKACLVALKIDPNNEVAQDNLDMVLQNKEIARKNAELRMQRTNAILNGINSFMQVLSQSYAQYSNISDDIQSSGNNSYSRTSNSSRSNQSSSENLTKNRDARTYSDYESQLIKMNTYYESQYNANQRMYIQSQMRSIRLKWEGRGYSMSHSQWEDWNGLKK